MNSLCRVSKRWMRLCDTDWLWQIVAIDEWMIQKIDPHPMTTIMSHAEAFTYFSMRNVTIKYSAVALLRHLANSSKLVYLDLSWQDVLRDINFLGKTVCSNLEYLLLDNCKNLNAYSVIQVVQLPSKLKLLSLNGLALSPDNVQAIAHLELSRLFSIGLTGAVLSLETAEIFFQNHPSLLFLQLSNRTIDKPGFRRLGAKYDVSIFFIQ